MGASISYSGKHVVITGGSEGIGQALAERFASDGAVVSLLSRNTQKLEKAQKRLKVCNEV
jgi:short-subunit dehydrogenase